MNICNTISAKWETALTEAIFTLQTLQEALSVRILDYLKENDEATLLDLLIATGMDTHTLDLQLDLLCQTNVVQLRSNIYDSWYKIDYQRLEKVNGIARQLVSGK